MAGDTGRSNIQFPQRAYIGFDGGKNSKSPKQWLLDNESPDCLNVIFGPGSVETRPGSTILNTATVGTFACDGLYTRHDNTGAETMTAWFGGTFHVLSGTTFAPIASGTSVFTAGVRVASAEQENYRFYCNGNVIPYKWNGTDFTRHGIYPPTTTATVVQTATAVTLLSGTYQWKVTYVNTNLVESDLGPATDATVFSGATGAQLTSVPVAPQSYGVGYRYIYRKETADSTYNRVGTLSNNTATTFADTTSAACATAAAPTDQGVPPKYNTIIQHNSRLFMIGEDDNFVWYTEAGNPYIVKATNFRRIGDATGELPAALGIWDNYLIVFCRNGQTWTTYMPDNDDTNWVDFRIRSNFGSRSPYGVFAAMNKLIFPATEGSKFVGFGALTAAGSDPEASLTEVGAVGSDLMTDGIEPDIDDFVESKVSEISSIVFKNKAYIAFTNTGGTYNDRILVMDFSNQNLLKKQKYTWAPWSGLNISQFCIYGGQLYGADSTPTGYVRKLLQDVYSDNGSAINSYYWTKEFYGNPGHENWYKDWRFANLLYELSGAWKIGFTVRVDSDSGTGVSSEIDVTPATSIWGSFRWGESDWDAGRTEKDDKKTLGLFRGKRIQFKFSNQNTAGRKFRIVGLTLKYNLKGLR